jgi:hypothetical protein
MQFQKIYRIKSKANICEKFKYLYKYNMIIVPPDFITSRLHKSPRLHDYHMKTEKDISSEIY